MSDKKKNTTDCDCKKKKSNVLSDDALEQVSGAGAFDDVPRVPEKPIDDDLKNKI